MNSNKPALSRYVKATITMLAIIAATQVFAVNNHPTQVLVWMETFPDRAVYHYTIVNQETVVGDDPSNAAIDSFSLGFDKGIRLSNPLLKTTPAKIDTPAGWKGEVIRTHATREVDIYWVADTIEDMIKPGQRLSGFSVELPTPDRSYADQAIYSVSFGDNTYTVSRPVPDPAHSATAPTDTTPPVLKVELSPNVLTPANGQYVEITASITVTDNVTTNPVVKLMSVTSNESTVGPVNAQGVRPLDIAGAYTGRDTRRFGLKARRESTTTPRVYTVTYSAMDTAGNESFAVAKVTVPWAQVVEQSQAQIFPYTIPAAAHCSRRLGTQTAPGG